MDFLAVFSLNQVEGWFEWGGYFILFGLLFACGLGLPLPEDIPLLLAGYFISQGKMNPFIAGAIAWLGIIGGDCVLYRLGHKYGLNITKVPFVGKHVTKGRILRAEQLFDRYGVWVVAVGRLFAGIRGAMVVAAGTIRFNFIKFVIADGLAALVSGGLFIALGYWAGIKLGSVDEMRQRIKGVEHWVFLGLGAAAALVFLFFWLQKLGHRKPMTDVALDRAAERAAHGHKHHHDEDEHDGGAAVRAHDTSAHSDTEGNGEMTDARK